MASPTIASAATAHPLQVQPSNNTARLGLLAFGTLLLAGLFYTIAQLSSELSTVRESSAWPFILLGLALLIALGFEFVNGFHDTANAVATVIYTHSLPPHVAVIWSGAWNFVGVMVASGAVAFGIVSLLPVELILQVSAGAGFAMVFALLIAAIIWNLATWYIGLPSSSSHTLIGSIIGVGLMNQWMVGSSEATSGVDWGQAGNVGKSLFLSPLLGFSAAAFLLLIAMRAIPVARLYRPPQGNMPPPLWIRSILILTCTGVSFAHGSNDGQKGMGLIMLILIGTVPTVYALNRAIDSNYTPAFVEISQQAERVLDGHTHGQPPPADSREEIGRYLRSRRLMPDTIPAVRSLSVEVRDGIAAYGSVAQVPDEQTGNIRNDMYLISEALRRMDQQHDPPLPAAEYTILKEYRSGLDRATKFIPTWVKAAVALALGLGTMIGWKRIVVTVGEKIGKSHLTYGQGACAEMVAMGTIGAADVFGLPVSTTHVLSSGVAGTMAANRSGLQWSTVRNLLMAWVLTLPASIILSGGLFWLFRQVV